MIEGVSTKFRSSYDHKLDAKNRVSIPAEWRLCSEGTLYFLPTDREGFPTIKVLTESKLDEIEQGVHQEAGMSTKEKNLFLDWLNGNCSPVTVNAQGKLLIPKKMCDSLNLNLDVILIGRGSFFEIWEPHTYNRMKTAGDPTITNIRNTYGFI